jgi:hypothetical protein
MKRFLRTGIVAMLLALLCMVYTTPGVSAHEKRQVGPYTFVVGFLNEPAYARQENSLDLTICSGSDCTYTVKDGMRVVTNPVLDAEKTLEFQVIKGAAQPLMLPLEARWGNPGKYTAYFIPSATGTYTFHLSGRLGTMKIDEQFTSGPNTFGDVSTIPAYPPQSPTAAPAPTEQNQLQSMQTLAYIGIALGIIGTLCGALGLAVAWRHRGGSAEDAVKATGLSDSRLRG